MEEVEEIIEVVVEAWEEADAGASEGVEADVGGNARVEAVVGGNAWAEAVAGGSTGESTLEAQVRQLLLDAEEAPETAGPVYQHTIFRPAVSMYEVNPQAFLPQLVSIGPYYHHMDSLRPMLKHKFRFYLRLLRKLYGSTDIHNNVIKTTVDNLVNRSKKCYFEGVEPNYSDSDFSLMMVLDGCFIIELFRYQTQKNVDDPVFGTRWMMAAIRVDLIKIGNQLLHASNTHLSVPDGEFPEHETIGGTGSASDGHTYITVFDAELPQREIVTAQANASNTLIFVPNGKSFEQEIIGGQVGASYAQGSLPNDDGKFQTIGGQVSESYTEGSLPDGEGKFQTIGAQASASYNTQESLPDGEEDDELSEQETVGSPESPFGTHLPAPDGSSRQQIVSCLVSASDLRYYRIYIKKGNSDLLNVKSNNLGSKIEIEVPSLLINLHTGPVLLNLVAHEQSNQSIPSYFMLYVVFLIGLVNSDKDVELLRSCKVFIPEMLISDEEVHMQLSNLARGVALAPESGISYLSATINARKNLPRAVWKATLRKFIYNKQTIVKLLAIYFSLIQTIIAFFIFYKEWI